MVPTLDSKVAIITGAGSGIGKATALLFAKQGAKVVVADISGEAETAGEIQDLKGEAIGFHADVSKEADVRRLIEETCSRYGRLDVLFNNAGILGDLVSTTDCTIENFDRVIAVNLRGVFLGLKFAIPIMVANGRGSIINTASVAALLGIPGNIAYGAAKAGVVILTKTAAFEYAPHNVRINAICPGSILTPIVVGLYGGESEARRLAGKTSPFQRVGEPEEVAAVASFLASDASSFITGAAIPIDGGWTAGVSLPLENK